MANTKVTGGVIADGAITAAKIASGALDSIIGGYLTTNTYATQSYVTTAVNNLIDAAPASLDTLNELAAALNDDANFATTVTNSLATKLNLSGGTLTGDLIVNTNVGIGTNSPAAPLDIFNSNAFLIKAVRNLTTDAGFQIGANNSGSFIDTLGIHTFSIQTNAIERMRVDSSGKVGIGTSSPASYYADNLVVSSGSNGGITIASDNTTNYNWLAFADGTTGNELYRGLVGYYHTNDSMLFYTSATEKMCIDSSGNVGIGTSSPISINNGLGLTIGNSSTQHQPYLSLSRNRLGGYFAGVQILNEGSVSSYMQEDGDGNLRFGTANTERMRIDSSGKVAIGGSTSSATITIRNTNSILRVNNTTSGLVSADLDFSVTNTGLGRIWHYGGYDMVFGTANTERMRIDSSGNVIVGGAVAQSNASGRGNITINGASTSILNFAIGESRRSYLYQTSTAFSIVNTEATDIAFYTSNLERMRITSGGYVGIGTSSPASQLHLSGVNGEAFAGGILTMFMENLLVALPVYVLMLQELIAVLECLFQWMIL